ncbi:MAG: aminotransferase class V-fold PLP-dependent enzyme [Candidatus Bipolaricaulota bacterium]
MEALVSRARETGILTVVDGAHAPGQIPLDLGALGADFYAGNCHKWVMAPKGAGFLHSQRENQSSLSPLVVSWGGEGSKGRGPSPFLDDHQWQGTRDISAFLSVPEAIRFMAEHDWDTVRRACGSLLDWAREALTEELGLAPVALGPATRPMQMAAFLLPSCPAVEVQRCLYDEHRIEVPVIPWNGASLLRISVQGYTTREDLEALLAALKSVLSLYRMGVKPPA